MVGSLSNSSLLLISNHIPISLSLMEGERQTKHRNDGGRPNKRGKVVSGRSRASSSSAPPQEDTPPIPLRMHPPFEYSRSRQCNYYETRRMSKDHRFWSYFHHDWYRSVLMPKKTPVVESKWVNWDWMEKKKDKHFRWVREACDFLDLTDMLQFEHN
jgi:hypothetical protein